MHIPVYLYNCAPFLETLITRIWMPQIIAPFRLFAVFYVSFVITPICSNASELVSSLMFAAKKTKTNSSLTFSQVHYLVCLCHEWKCGVSLDSCMEQLLWITHWGWEYLRPWYIFVILNGNTQLVSTEFIGSLFTCSIGNLVQVHVQ